MTLRCPPKNRRTQEAALRREEESQKICVETGKMRGANFSRGSFMRARSKRDIMDRRDFLRTTSTVLAGTTSCEGNLAANPAAAASDGEGRLVFPINRNWRYNRSFVEGAHGHEFDDSAFERVVIPHTNVRLPWHSFDDKEYEFVSIYRRQISFACRGARQACFRRLRRRR